MYFHVSVAIEGRSYSAQCTVLYDYVVLNTEFGRMRKEKVLTSFEVLSIHFCVE